MIDDRLGLRSCSHCVLRPPPSGSNARGYPRLPGSQHERAGDDGRAAPPAAK